MADAKGQGIKEERSYNVPESTTAKEEENKVTQPRTKDEEMPNTIGINKGIAKCRWGVTKNVQWMHVR